MDFKGVSFEELDKQLIRLSKEWVIKNTQANYLDFDLFIEEAIIAHARAVGTLLLSRNEKIKDWEIEVAADKIREQIAKKIKGKKNAKKL